MPRAPHRAPPELAPPALPGRDELYRLLVENVTDYAIIMLSPEGRVATWTEGAGRLTGYAEAEALGAPIAFLYPPDEVEAGGPDRDLHIAEAEGRCEAVAWRVRKDGSRFWASAVLTAVDDEAGRRVGFGLITRDLTERKEVARRYEESRQRYRSLFENNPNAVLGFDRDGSLRSANPAAEALAGYALDDLLALSVWALVVAEDRERVRGLFARAAEGAPQHAETALVHRDGGRVRLNLTLVPIVVEGETIGVYAIAEDITERKRAEAEREALLRRERQARAGAEAASRAKTDFLAVVSHELKTPLNVITGFADLLRDGDAGPLTDAQRRHLDRIRASSGQLLHMIEELLDYTRMEQGSDALAVGPVDVWELLEEAAGEAEEGARAKGLAVRLDARDGPVVVPTDRARARRLLGCILANAVKFTETGEVRLGARREAAAVAVVVADTGIGIAPDQLEMIWEPFWQGDKPLVRRAGGAGLGLALARRIARLLGGEIECRSVPGEGSTFTVRLPLRPA
jgi:PAS domain S-box-containing protein